MSDCCVATAEPAAAACPRCGAVGRPVPDRTIEAILGPSQAKALLPLRRRFCRTPGCEVVYYGEDGRLVERSAVPVRVGIKEHSDLVPLCYCFGHSRADVRRELIETGSCSIPDRISAQVRAGRCLCETSNPSGACCLGEVNRAVQEEQVALAARGRRGP